MKYLKSILKHLILIAIALLLTACGENPMTSSDTTLQHPHSDIHFEALQSWQRHPTPVLRDPWLSYEVAADPHVFRDAEGMLRMVYTGPNPANDYATIKLATAKSYTEWTAGSVLLEGSNSEGLDLNKETSFYRLANSGKHQIYYIGYEDNEVYQSQIFLAEADTLTGPYRLPTAPIIATGMQGGHEVVTMTSPSIVEDEGRLYMVYCAWKAFPEPTIVWVHGAISDDEGQSWDVVGEVPVPSCMEGSLTAGPDGRFYAVAQGKGGFVIGRSETPFGPYEMLPEPVMTCAGAPWEVDEMNTPQLLFEVNTAYLYYTGADYAKGWWTMLATTDWFR
ncbi:MAG: family 43 glycosylhydrolase [Cyanobacteria bacterium]|nr:family 43 glycosylhydrolase [Cyanobacteria bacterium GSL.Bin1]